MNILSYYLEVRMYRKWTNEKLIQAVKESNSYSEVINKLGLKSKTAGNRSTIKKYIKILNIDISHFHSERFGKRKSKPLDDVLVKNSEYTSSSSLKKRVIKEGMLEEKCYECNITHWNNKKLSLQLDHINGVNDD